VSDIAAVCAALTTVCDVVHLTMEDGDVTLHAIGSWDRVAVELDVENRLSGTGVPL
jgi:hypothetical protein